MDTADRTANYEDMMDTLYTTYRHIRDTLQTHYRQTERQTDAQTKKNQDGD